MLTLSIFILLIINPALSCAYPAVPSEEIHCDALETSNAYSFFRSFEPVCGYSWKEPAGYRYIAANMHDTCKLPTVRAFFFGPCKGDKVFCDSTYRPTECQEPYYNPVCAFITGCEGEDCKKTMKNPCVACEDSNVDYYIRGRCLEGPHEHRTFCDPSYLPKNCEQTDEPVCAYLKGCTGWPLCCARTIKNGCIACSTSGIEFYIPGECPNEDSFCDSNN